MKKSRSTIYLLIALLALVVVSVFAFFFAGQIFKKKDSVNSADKVEESSTPPQSDDPSNPIIMKVGEEYLYKKDLDTEFATYPDKSDASKKILKDKMILDSQIIQGGLKAGTFSFKRGDKILDNIYSPSGYVENTLYQKSDKDYPKRIALVNAIKQAIEDKIIAYKGSCVSIWYVNSEPGKAGLVEGKKIAKEKINKLHDDIVAGKISMQDAGSAVSSDTSLANLDSNYELNAYFEFVKSKNDVIVNDANFNDVIHTLKVNEVSNVANVEDADSKGSVITGYFTFCKLTFKDTSSFWGSYLDWEKDTQNTFKVINY